MSRSLGVIASVIFVACSANLQTLGDGSSSCSACNTSADCSGEEVCSQLENDNVCLKPCLFSSDCGTGFQCTLIQTFNGHSLSACAAISGPCGELPPGTQDAGASQQGGDAGSTVQPPDAGVLTPAPDGGAAMQPSGYCGDLAGPDVSGTGCHCGKPGQCAANNCYGGWYCDTATNKCVSPPSSCPNSTPDAGSPLPTPDAGSPFPGPDAGSPSSTPGSIDPHNGGTSSELYFAVVGDTRPGNVDDTANYPTAIISGIFADIGKLSPTPSFIVATGDYMFATPGAGNDGPQMQLYMQARGQVPNIPYWPTMGNHECTGYTASNCGPNGTDGITSNYQTFLSSMMQPIGESNPYYTRKITATDGSWTAKFIFVAANAWDSTQESWFQQQLQQSTTYTFIVHHEPSHANTAPGISAIERDSAGAAVTLHLVGHTHTWEKGSGELIMGNGGAPLTGSGTYGFTTFRRRASDGAIVIQGYDYMTNQPASGQTFCIDASGSQVSQCP